MINIELLKNISSTKVVPKGGILVREGRETGEIFLLLKGSAAVFEKFKKPGERQAAVISSGDYFGEISMIFDSRWNVTVVALEELIVMTIQREYALEFFRVQPQAADDLRQMLIRIFDRLNISGDRMQNQYWAQFAIDRAQDTAAPDELLGGPLFPEGHRDYELPINNEDKTYIYEKVYHCPVCDNSFKALAVRGSKLVVDHTDRDMRIHYKNIEPMFYDVVNCPQCYYSALTDVFDTAMKSERSKVVQFMKPYMVENHLLFGKDRDSGTVFAGYYLALLCAVICIDKPKKSTSRLWYKLARIYSDCGDEEMMEYACKEALSAYLYSYENYNYEGQQEQQLMFIIGDLYSKLNDLQNSRKFLFKAKTYRGGSKAISDMADYLIDDIREKSKEQAR